MHLSGVTATNPVNQQQNDDIKQSGNTTGSGSHGLLIRSTAICTTLLGGAYALYSLFRSDPESGSSSSNVLALSQRDVSASSSPSLSLTSSALTVETSATTSTIGGNNDPITALNTPPPSASSSPQATMMEKFLAKTNSTQSQTTAAKDTEIISSKKQRKKRDMPVNPLQNEKPTEVSHQRKVRVKRLFNGRFMADDPCSPVVSLGTNSGRFCTGTLISPQHVLTAAHCFDHRAYDCEKGTWKSLNGYEAALGSFDYAKAQKINVTEAHAPKGYLDDFCEKQKAFDAEYTDYEDYVFDYDNNATIIPETVTQSPIQAKIEHAIRTNNLTLLNELHENELFYDVRKPSVSLDVAVLKLQQPVPDCIKPMELVSSAQFNRIEHRCPHYWQTMKTYGARGKSPTDFTPQVVYDHVKLRKEGCVQNSVIISSANVRPGNAQLCSGDSGGPLIMKRYERCKEDVIVGVTHGITIYPGSDPNPDSMCSYYKKASLFAGITGENKELIKKVLKGHHSTDRENESGQ